MGAVCCMTRQQQCDEYSLLSGFSAVTFDTIFTVLLTVSKGLENTHGKLSNTEVTWMFGNTFSQNGLLIDGTNWINETLTVEVLTVSRTDSKESGRQG